MIEVTELLRAARGAELARDERGGPARFAARASLSPLAVWNLGGEARCGTDAAGGGAGSRPVDDESARRVLSELKSCRVRRLIVTWGASTITAQLTDLLGQARAAGIECELRIAGAAIDRNTADLLFRAGVRQISVGVDDVAPPCRQHRDARALLTALAALRCSAAAGLRTALRLSLLRRTARELEAVIAASQQVGSERFVLSHSSVAPLHAAQREDALTAAQRRAVLQRLFECADDQLARGITLQLATDGNDSDGVALLLWVEQRYGDSAARRLHRLLLSRGGNASGEQVIAIDGGGLVYPGAGWTTPVLGDLRRQSLADILRHPLRAELRTRVERLTGRCGGCAYRHLCRGSHRERALALDDDLWAPDPWCVLGDAEIGYNGIVQPARGHP